MYNTCTEIVFNGYHLAAFVMSGGVGILVGIVIGINKEYERQKALGKIEDIEIPDWL
jgi:hypothetical protein